MVPNSRLALAGDRGGAAPAVVCDLRLARQARADGGRVRERECALRAGQSSEFFQSSSRATIEE